MDKYKQKIEMAKINKNIKEEINVSSIYKIYLKLKNNLWKFLVLDTVRSEGNV